MIELGCLKDPLKFSEALVVDQFDKNFLMGCLFKMLLIRYVEEAIAELVVDGSAKTPCHLAIGQEAVPVGVSVNLNVNDKVFGCHRSHGHFLALEASVESLIAEVLGKKTGASKGMGGSMHLVDMTKGFYGSVPIVGGTIPIAVGAALAEKMSNSGQVAVAYFGDGACEEGVLHESLNFASLHKLPVIFVCENNLFSSHLDIELRQPKDSMSRFALAHHIQHRLVDGNNVCEVAGVSRELLSCCRNGNGPAFLEAVTYRWRGHVGANEDVDVGVKRCLKDIVAWKKRDPILRLYMGMQQAGKIVESEYNSMLEGIKKQILDAIKNAQMAAYPHIQQLDELVYAKF